MAPRNISDSSENYRRYNFQAFADISGNSGNIKFSEISQPYWHQIVKKMDIAWYCN